MLQYCINILYPRLHLQDPFKEGEDPDEYFMSIFVSYKSSELWSYFWISKWRKK